MASRTRAIAAAIPIDARHAVVGRCPHERRAAGGLYGIRRAVVCNESDFQHCRNILARRSSLVRLVTARRRRRQSPSGAISLAALGASKSAHDRGEFSLPTGDGRQGARIAAPRVSAFAGQPQFVLSEFIAESHDFEVSHWRDCTDNQ